MSIVDDIRSGKVRLFDPADFLLVNAVRRDQFIEELKDVWPDDIGNNVPGSICDSASQFAEETESDSMIEYFGIGWLDDVDSPEEAERVAGDHGGGLSVDILDEIMHEQDVIDNNYPISTILMARESGLEDNPVLSWWWTNIVQVDAAQKNKEFLDTLAMLFAKDDSVIEYMRTYQTDEQPPSDDADIVMARKSALLTEQNIAAGRRFLYTPEFLDNWIHNAFYMTDADAGLQVLKAYAEGELPNSFESKLDELVGPAFFDVKLAQIPVGVRLMFYKPHVGDGEIQKVNEELLKSQTYRNMVDETSYRDARCMWVRDILEAAKLPADELYEVSDLPSSEEILEGWINQITSLKVSYDQLYSAMVVPFSRERSDMDGVIELLERYAGDQFDEVVPGLDVNQQYMFPEVKQDIVDQKIQYPGWQAEASKLEDEIEIGDVRIDIQRNKLVTVEDKLLGDGVYQFDQYGVRDEKNKRYTVEKTDLKWVDDNPLRIPLKENPDIQKKKAQAKLKFKIGDTIKAGSSVEEGAEMHAGKILDIRFNRGEADYLVANFDSNVDEIWGCRVIDHYFDLDDREPQQPPSDDQDIVVARTAASGGTGYGDYQEKATTDSGTGTAGDVVSTHQMDIAPFDPTKEAQEGSPVPSEYYRQQLERNRIVKHSDSVAMKRVNKLAVEAAGLLRRAQLGSNVDPYKPTQPAIPAPLPNQNQVAGQPLGGGYSNAETQQTEQDQQELYQQDTDMKNQQQVNQQTQQQGDQNKKFQDFNIQNTINQQQKTGQAQSQPKFKVGDNVEVVEDVHDDVNGDRIDEIGRQFIIGSIEPHAEFPRYHDDKTDYWYFGDEIKLIGQSQQPSASKDQLSDRIYDITQNRKPESAPGELNDLMAKWKQLTGTPMPRFLGGQNNQKKEYRETTKKIVEDAKELARKRKEKGGTKEDYAREFKEFLDNPDAEDDPPSKSVEASKLDMIFGASSGNENPADGKIDHIEVDNKEDRSQQSVTDHGRKVMLGETYSDENIYPDAVTFPKHRDDVRPHFNV